MKKFLIIFCLVLVTDVACATWRYNPFTKKLDYYESGVSGVMPAPSDPVGGATIDSQARGVIESIIDLLESAGVISSTALASWRYNPFTKKFDYYQSGVTEQSYLSDPSGGLTADAEARLAIREILDLLIAAGIMSDFSSDNVDIFYDTTADEFYDSVSKAFFDTGTNP